MIGTVIHVEELDRLGRNHCFFGKVRWQMLLTDFNWIGVPVRTGWE